MKLKYFYIYMSQNRNNNYNKKKNKPIKFIFDTSNSNIFLTNTNESNIFRNKNDLHTSNNKLIKFNNDTNSIDFNNNEKNNIKPFSNCNTMVTTNKLITSLDDSNINDNQIIKDQTDCLLKLILNQTEKDFNKNYNSPYFSGIPIMPTIKDNSLFSDEDIKKIIKEEVLIDASVDNLIDLINLCDKYPLANNI